MNLSELISFLKSIDARPKKSLSQNFLVDPNIVRKIVQTAEVEAGDTVLEIGPGPGALTSALLEKGARVYAVEMDTIFARELERFQNGQLTVFESDILEFPLHQLPPNIKIVANLPYHITTPILEKVFASSFSSLTIMVQKEVAERMGASSGTRDFSSLSIFVQFYTTKKASFPVAASCFYPRPKVDSTVIRLDSHTPPEIDTTHFFSLVHRAFQKRRKMITSSLGLDKVMVRAALASMGVRLDSRPEDLSLQNWLDLAKKLS